MDMEKQHGEQLELTDETLAVATQNGDTEAFGTLVERYEQKLLRYGRKFLSNPDDIQDLVQNAFISAYQNIKGFDSRQRFSPWMYRIAHNSFVNGLRQKKRSPFISVDFDTFFSHPVYEDPTERERDQKEIKLMIDKGLEKISQNYREVLTLYFIEDMSYKDIADVLQIPTSTVGVRVKRAKEALKKACEQLDEYRHGT